MIFNSLFSGNLHVYKFSDALTLVGIYVVVYVLTHSTRCRLAQDASPSVVSKSSLFVHSFVQTWPASHPAQRIKQLQYTAALA